MKTTYKPLFVQVSELVDKKLASLNITVSPSGNTNLQSAGIGSATNTMQDVVASALPQTIITGLEVIATNPISNQIVVTAGKGVASGNLFVLHSDTTLTVPFDNKNTVYYVYQYFERVIISTVTYDTYLPLAKIIVPSPGVTDVVRDEDNGSQDAYIMQRRELKFYCNAAGKLEEDSRELFRDNLSDILASNLIGTINLNENLKISNIAGSLMLDSDSLSLFDTDSHLLTLLNSRGIYFYATTGVEIAKFGVDGAFIGNIEITPSTIQSRNFITQVSGFRIKDDGNAEFNDVTLRGTLYTSTIAGNIYISPDVQFIGDMNFTGDVWVNADHTIGFDKNLGADTYWKYNSSTQYLECHVDGILRMEI